MNFFDLFGFHFLNQFAGKHPYHPVLDAIMSFFAQYALEIYAVLFVVAWFTLPKTNTKQRHALVVSFLSGVVALLINFIISHFIWYRPRPFATLHPGQFTQLIPHGADASFPSDHTSGSFGFAAASWGKSRKWVSVSFTCIALITMISRVYVGVHWPTDVLAGVVVGFISSKIMWKLSRFVYPLTILIMRIFKMGGVSKETIA